MERNPTNLEMMCYFALRASLPALSAPGAPRCCVWPHSRLLADCSGSTQQQQHRCRAPQQTTTAARPPQQQLSWAAQHRAADTSDSELSRTGAGPW